MEIVTWVLQGSLVHQDSEGHNGVIYPGLAQRMSAGTGILHSEKNDSWRLHGDGPRRPGALRADVGRARRGGHHPGYEQLEIDDELLSRRPRDRSPPAWHEHDGAAAIRIKNRYAALHAARLQPARACSCPSARSYTCSSPAAASTLEGAGALATGDAVRLTATGGQQVTATRPAEILFWEMHATLG